MALSPLSTLLQLKPRPETTLSLETAIAAGAVTVREYRFTPSIRGHFHEVLQLAASDRGQGYWVQAEYGAGKTHLLATLAVLLAGGEEAWDGVSDPDLAGFRKAVRGRSGFLPVIINCKGLAGTEGGAQSLQRVIENAIADALRKAGLEGRIPVTTADEVEAWWNEAPAGIRDEVGKALRKLHRDAPHPEDLLAEKGRDAFATAVLEAARAVRIEVPRTRDIRTRLSSIYTRLTGEAGFGGILFVIDEFKSWQDLHPVGSPASAEDEHVLETLAFHLPVDEHARIVTVVASQGAPLEKLRGGAEGDRFRLFSLFASEQSAREYDEIVAWRVRDLAPGRSPEVEEYFRHYATGFKFLSGVTQERFREVFPFQPRCFEVVRRLTQFLATTRTSIHYVHEVLACAAVTSRPGLVRAADLLQSETLQADLQTSPRYVEGWRAFRSAMDGLPSIAFDNESDRQMADDVVRTLFLWHCANPTAPKGLSASELAEACLVEGDGFVPRGEDVLAGIILPRLNDLAQITYSKAEGAKFRIVASAGPAYAELLATYTRTKVADPEAGRKWLDLLVAPPTITDGVLMLFHDMTLDKAKKVVGRANKVRYDGEKVVADHWTADLGRSVTDRTDYATHFRIVYLREPADISPADIEDERVAVVVPAAWRDVAAEELRTLCAIRKIEEDYKDRQGPDADLVKQRNTERRKELHGEVPRLQAEALRGGRIVTKAGLGLDPAVLFVDAGRADEVLGSKLLEAAYSRPPFNPGDLRRELSGAEPEKMFEALFQGSAAAAATGAVDNFAQGLGLTSRADPRRFDSSACPFFEDIRRELEAANGDLRLYAFYDRYTGAPYGVPAEVLSLYLAAFVRAGRPPCEIALKSDGRVTLKGGGRPRTGRLGFNEVPQVEWKRGLHQGLDRLVLVKGPAWNDLVPCFRLLADGLVATDEPTQVQSQQDRLAAAYRNWTGRIKGLRDRLKGLGSRLGQDVRPLLAHLDDLDAVCATDAHHLETFETVFEERFGRDADRFRNCVTAVRRLEELDQNHLHAVADAVTYLDAVTGLPDGDPIRAGLDAARAGFDLAAFAAEPARAAAALAAFEAARDTYRDAWRRHYRDLRVALIGLRGRLEAVQPVVAGLSALNTVPDLGAKDGEGLDGRLRALLNKVDASRLAAEPPDAMAAPIADGVTLATTAPETEVASLEVDAGMAAVARRERLADAGVRDVLAAAGDPNLAPLLAAVHAGDDRVAVALVTPAVAARIRELLQTAQVVVVRIDLSDFGGFVVDDQDGSVDAAVERFRDFLKRKVGDARKANPKKTVRLDLR